MYSFKVDGSRLKDSIVWSDTDNKYLFKRDKKPVSDKFLYKVVRQETERTENKLIKLTERFTNGNITFKDWQDKSKEIVKNSHVNAVRLARGGSQKTYAIHYLDVGNDLRKIHYPALKDMGEKIEKGELTKAQIVARSKTFGTATKTTFEKNRLTNYKGVMLGRRRLGSCGNSCFDCISFASQGWLPLSRITPPGVNCACRFNCCCSVEIKPAKEMLVNQ